MVDSVRQGKVPPNWANNNAESRKHVLKGSRITSCILSLPEIVPALQQNRFMSIVCCGVNRVTVD